MLLGCQEVSPQHSGEVMFDLFNDLDQCSGLCQYSGSDRVVHVVSMYCNNNNFVWAGVL